jgi:uncharacterized protein (TIGR02466 family)
MVEIFTDTSMLFSTPVHVFKYPNTDILKAMLDKCVSMEKDEEGVIKSNVGGWQGDNIFLPEVFPELADFIQNCMIKVTEDCVPCDIKLQNSWVNINREGDSNLVHKHPGSEWSSTFYLKVPGGGIVFEDPRVAKSMGDAELFKPESPLSSSKTYHPMPGDLVIFPAWLSHFVEPHYVKGECRVTIPTNITVTAKKDQVC